MVQGFQRKDSNSVRLPGQRPESQNDAKRAGANSSMTCNSGGYSDIPGLQELQELERQLKNKHMINSGLTSGFTSNFYSAQSPVGAKLLGNNKIVVKMKSNPYLNLIAETEKGGASLSNDYMETYPNTRTPDTRHHI